MYRELIEKLTAGNQWANVQEPCPEEEIQKAEEYVGFTFPEELKALLRETNELTHLRFMSHLSMIILSQAKTEKKIRVVSLSLVFR